MMTQTALELLSKIDRKQKGKNEATRTESAIEPQPHPT
jgi:hypothetical protein